MNDQEVSNYASSIVSTAIAHVLEKIKQEGNERRQEVPAFALPPSRPAAIARVLAMSQEPVCYATRREKVVHPKSKLAIYSYVATTSVCSEPVARNYSQRCQAETKEEHKKQNKKTGCYHALLKVIQRLYSRACRRIQ